MIRFENERVEGALPRGYSRKRCDPCKGRGTFLSLPQHPRGAGHKVPCSSCGGKGFHIQKD